MTRFVERAIVRAGLGPLLEARVAGDVAMARATLAGWRDADLLILGALADIVRAAEIGDAVTIHHEPASSVLWIDGTGAELAVLREVAIARIVSSRDVPIGVDWSKLGLELAQVALGFGASELRGAITKKNGLPILASDARRVKGQGMVDLGAIKRDEIVALVRHAGRRPQFTIAKEEDAGVRLHP